LKNEKGTEEYANFYVLTAVLIILFIGIYHVKLSIVFDVSAETTASIFRVIEEE
jgi:hypothetical protein